MLSLVLDWKRTEATMQEMARERGATLFQLVELTRDWNARHGGVYVPSPKARSPIPISSIRGAMW